MHNLLHLKYAVEIEKTGSISKAAENLYMGQPQLSKAIRELEDSLGVAIFKRTPKGVNVTEQGKVFLAYAKNILALMAEMEALAQPAAKKQKFDISVPRASYISHAFTEFVRQLDNMQNMALNYYETNSVRAMKNVADSANNLAIIRYQVAYENYFLQALAEHDLRYQQIWEFDYLALMSQQHPLANKPSLELADLSPYIEIVHGDLAVPSLPASEAKRLVMQKRATKNISIYERGSQFELLVKVPTTYIWVSPVPQDILQRFSLTQKCCHVTDNRYKDLLIFRQGYKFSSYDELFLAELKKTVHALTQASI